MTKKFKARCSWPRMSEITFNGIVPIFMCKQFVRVKKTSAYYAIVGIYLFTEGKRIQHSMEVVKVPWRSHPKVKPNFIKCEHSREFSLATLVI